MTCKELIRFSSTFSFSLGYIPFVGQRSLCRTLACVLTRARHFTSASFLCPSTKHSVVLTFLSCASFQLTFKQNVAQMISLEHQPVSPFCRLLTPINNSFGLWILWRRWNERATVSQSRLEWTDAASFESTRHFFSFALVKRRSRIESDLWTVDES